MTVVYFMRFLLFLSNIFFISVIFELWALYILALLWKNKKFSHWAALVRISSPICIKFNGTKKIRKFWCASACGHSAFYLIFWHKLTSRWKFKLGNGGKFKTFYLWYGRFWVLLTRTHIKIFEFFWFHWILYNKESLF